MWWGWLLVGVLLALYVHFNFWPVVQRWLLSRQGLCVCGREPSGCCCPADDDVFTFTPWDELSDEERAEDDPGEAGGP